MINQWKTISNSFNLFNILNQESIFTQVWHFNECINIKTQFYYWKCICLMTVTLIYKLFPWVQYCRLYSHSCALWMNCLTTPQEVNENIDITSDHEWPIHITYVGGILHGPGGQLLDKKGDIYQPTWRVSPWNAQWHVTLQLTINWTLMAPNAY